MNIARLAVPAAAALLLAAPAAASTLRVRDAHGGLTISTRQDPGVYRTTVLVPAAYWLRPRAHVKGAAVVEVASASGPLSFAGRVRNADARAYATDDCAADKGYSHLAVWLLDLRQSNGTARAKLPIFVDAGPGGTTALTWCASRDAGLSVTGVAFTLDPVFSSPLRHGSYRWHAQFDSGTTADVFATLRQ